MESCYEFRYVYLYRKDTSPKNTNLEQKGALASHKKTFFTATDYFNEMVVFTGNPKSDGFSSLWGIWPGSYNGLGDVAAQSYTLYSNNNTAEVFGNEEQISPFDCANRKYLSIIQVHITPECFARFKYEQLNDYEGLKIVEPFLVELKNVLKKYCEKKSGVFCKIYYMLSSGDFAVVVASDEPDSSFQISTQIRRRKKVIDMQNKENFVLFKTYTLFTIREDYTDNNNGVMNETFVLRGCFSNLYWRDYDKICKELFEQELPINSGKLLNGRYDFTQVLTYDEYQEVINGIVLPNIINNDSRKKVAWLKYMKSKEYLSFINVRLLLSPNIIDYQDPDQMEGNVALEFQSDEREYLYKCIDNNIKEALKYHDIVREKLEVLTGYRKNLRHNMHLLRKFILLCKSINSVSDTRIYAVVLLNQIHSILTTLESTIEVYVQSENNPAILDEIDECLQQSIQSVDAYAEYIRNNNLQTLQMPNYNTETSSSIEKLLIGYSQFVEKMYKIREFVEQDLKDSEEESVVPIVVPALDAQSVSVEVMFADGSGTKWEEEKTIRQKRGNRKLLILKSPTLTELANVGTMIFSLMHEVAHQIRYESRKERNEVITRICFYNLADRITEAFYDKFQMETGVRDISFEVCRLICDAVYEALMPEFWNSSENNNPLSLQPNQEVPLIFFRKVLDGWCESFIREYEQYGKEHESAQSIKKDIIYYFNAVKQYYNYEDKKLITRIGEIWDNLNGLENKESAKNLLENFKNCHSQVLLNYRNSNGTETGFHGFENLGNLVIDKISNLIAEIQKSDFNSKSRSNSRAIEIFENNLYAALCKKWDEFYKENIKKREPTGQSYHHEVLLPVWDAFGRWLGIDVNIPSNQKRLNVILSDIIIQRGKAIHKDFPQLIGQYREETADIFMCVKGKFTASDYLHLMIINLKNEPDVENKYIIRILRVMSAVWLQGQVNIEDAFKKTWKEMLKNAWVDIEKILNMLPENYNNRKVRKEINKEYGEKICDLLREIYFLEWNDMDPILKKLQYTKMELKGCYSRLYEFVKIYEFGIQKQAEMEARWPIREIWKMVRRYMTYISVLHDLLNEAPRILTFFFHQKRYMEDLEKGVNLYKEKSSPEEESINYEKLRPIYPKLDMEHLSEYHAYGLELLMGLFYEQKIYYAQHPEINWTEKNEC